MLGQPADTASPASGSIASADFRLKRTGRRSARLREMTATNWPELSIDDSCVLTARRRTKAMARRPETPVWPVESALMAQVVHLKRKLASGPGVPAGRRRSFGGNACRQLGEPPPIGDRRPVGAHDVQLGRGSSSAMSNEDRGPVVVDRWTRGLERAGRNGAAHSRRSTRRPVRWGIASRTRAAGYRAVTV